MKIAYITSNQQKFEEAQLILKSWQLERVPMELTEIQGDAYEVTRAKAREALARIQQPLIVEDVCVFCEALNGLPGPYAKDFLLKLGAQGVYELVHKYSDRRARVSCIAAYAVPGQAPELFEGVISGHIVAPRGSLNYGVVSFNPIFQPEGSLKTFGEMTMAEHAATSMRRIALTKLQHFLEHQPLHKP